MSEYETMRKTRTYSEVGTIGPSVAQMLLDEKYSSKRRSAYAGGRTSFKESGRHLLEAGKDLGRMVYYPVAGPFKSIAKWADCSIDEFMGAEDIVEIIGLPLEGIGYGIYYAFHVPYHIIASACKAIKGTAQAGSAMASARRKSSDRKHGEFVLDSDEFVRLMGRIDAAKRDIVGEGFYKPVRGLGTYTSPRKVKIKLETGSVTPVASEYDGI